MAEHHYVERTETGGSGAGVILGLLIGFLVFALLSFFLFMSGRLTDRQTGVVPAVPVQDVVPAQQATIVDPITPAEIDRQKQIMDLYRYFVEVNEAIANAAQSKLTDFSTFHYLLTDGNVRAWTEAEWLEYDRLAMRAHLARDGLRDACATYAERAQNVARLTNEAQPQLGQCRDTTYS